MFPITVTLHNAGQLQAVIAALNAEAAAPAASPSAAPAKAKDPKNVKGQPAPSPTASATDAKTQSATVGETGNDAPAASAKPTAEVAKEDAPAAKAVSYAELQAAVLKLHRADSNAAKPIAEGMGFPNFKAMPDDKWPEALEKVNAALAERGVV